MEACRLHLIHLPLVHFRVIFNDRVFATLRHPGCFYVHLLLVHLVKKKNDVYLVLPISRTITH